MYNTVAAVAGAVVIGGLVLYTGYALTQDGQEPDAPRVTSDAQERLAFEQGLRETARRGAERSAGSDSASLSRPRSGLRGRDDEESKIATADTPEDALESRSVVDRLSGTVPAGSSPPDDRDPDRDVRLAAKPDTDRAFSLTREPPDVPDAERYFTENRSNDFAPCVKADGTRYVGPGTALNPFAPGSPCLPRATAESFEVASLAPRQGTPTEVNAPVDAISPMSSPPRQPLTPAPPFGGNFGSDYAS